ncbi:MAG: PCI domain-containing protein [Candidatus Thorarchaeota archaeon]
MSEKNGDNENYEKDAEKMRWELNEIRDDLIDELDDLTDEFREEIEDIIEESEDVKDELKEELIELEEERKALLNEIGDVRYDLGDLGDDAKERIEKAKVKLESLTQKLHKYEYKLREKVRKKLEKARSKAVKRINISVDPKMSDEWKEWAEGLGASVSELVRKSMKFVKNNIGDLESLEEFGRKMEKFGQSVEKAVNESEIKEFGKQMAKKYGKGKHTSQIKVTVSDETDKERIKKRIQGLIKLQKSIPIDKLSQTLNIPEEEAENLIYELAAEGIEGDLEEGVFKYSSSSEDVLSKLFELIDKM